MRPWWQRWFATSHCNKSYYICDVANLCHWDLIIWLWFHPPTHPEEAQTHRVQCLDPGGGGGITDHRERVPPSLSPPWTSSGRARWRAGRGRTCCRRPAAARPASASPGVSRVYKGGSQGRMASLPSDCAWSIYRVTRHLESQVWMQTIGGVPWLVVAS